MKLLCKYSLSLLKPNCTLFFVEIVSYIIYFSSIIFDNNWICIWTPWLLCFGLYLVAVKIQNHTRLIPILRLINYGSHNIIVICLNIKSSAPRILLRVVKVVVWVELAVVWLYYLNVRFIFTNLCKLFSFCMTKQELFVNTYLFISRWWW